MSSQSVQTRMSGDEFMKALHLDRESPTSVLATRIDGMKMFAEHPKPSDDSGAATVHKQRKVTILIQLPR